MACLYRDGTSRAGTFRGVSRLLRIDGGYMAKAS